MQAIQTVCAWCKQFMHVKWNEGTVGPVLISHGICMECVAALEVEAVETNHGLTVVGGEG